MPWTDVEATSGYTEVILSAEIPDGVPTWVKVRATNNGELLIIAMPPVVLSIELIGFFAAGLTSMVVASSPVFCRGFGCKNV